MKTPDQILALVASTLRPPPRMTVSQWADKYRKLSAESAAIPGQWRTEVVEYMREPMDCVLDPRYQRVVVMAAAQVAKSELLLNSMGYLIDHEPSPILLVQPTLETAEEFSKDRIAPMLRDTPALKHKVSDDKSRTSDNTIKKKKFEGGHLTIIGANSPSGLASKPIRAVFGDEIDRYPVSAGTEGDPISLAIKRTATFWNRIVALVSTPTNKGASRIEAAHDEGDMRQYHVPCGDCGEFQVLRWSNVRWDKDKPETAVYVCEHCGCMWSDVKRIAAMRKGHWRARQDYNGVASFHVTGLMSPFVSMADGVREFLNAQANPERLKVWVNTYLGETWEERGQRIEAHALMDRLEAYESRVPDGVTILTAGADVQDDRVEVEVVGWGNYHESWSIDHSVFYGDPSTNAIWAEVRTHLKQIFVHPRFGEMIIRATCIDTGGHHTHRVYDFVRATDRVYGIKGIGGDDKPLVGRPSASNYGKIPLFPIGVHTAKDLIYARLKVDEGEAGYSHFPEGRTHDYFEQLTAEKKVRRFHKGYAKEEYVKFRTRNEALDLRVYATAALEMLRVDLEAQRRAQEARLRQAEQEVTEDESKGRRSRPQKKGGFVNGWAKY